MLGCNWLETVKTLRTVGNGKKQRLIPYESHYPVFSLGMNINPRKC